MRRRVTIARRSPAVSLPSSAGRTRADLGGLTSSAREGRPRPSVKTALDAPCEVEETHLPLALRSMSLSQQHLPPSPTGRGIPAHLLTSSVSQTAAVPCARSYRVQRTRTPASGG